MLNSDYVTGLVDGEGSFTFYIRNPETDKSAKRRVIVEPKFYLKLIEKDKNILYELKKFFGCGQVYYQKDSRINHQNCYRYEVFRRDELIDIIIPFFKRHQLKLVSKRNDFRLFCNLMERIGSNEHKTVWGLKNLYRIKQRMH